MKANATVGKLTPYKGGFYAAPRRTGSRYAPRRGVSASSRSSFDAGRGDADSFKAKPYDLSKDSTVMRKSGAGLRRAQ